MLQAYKSTMNTVITVIVEFDTISAIKGIFKSHDDPILCNKNKTPHVE